jgi:hypothetical protein
MAASRSRLAGWAGSRAVGRLTTSSTLGAWHGVLASERMANHVDDIVPPAAAVLAGAARRLVDGQRLDLGKTGPAEPRPLARLAAAGQLGTEPLWRQAVAEWAAGGGLVG